MARYRKVDTRIWNDQKFNQLSDDGKLVFFLLLTHPHLTSLGAMRASLSGLSSELHWSLEKFQKAFDESFIKSMVCYDNAATLMWLPNFLKYNKPESPNVIRSWENSLDNLPECNLKDYLINHSRTIVRNLPVSFQEALPEDFAKVLLNQEQEQEHEQKQKQDKKHPPVSLRQMKINSQELALREKAKEVLDFLNKKALKIYLPSDFNIRRIMTQLKKGATVGQCKKVIAKKYREWKGDSKMASLIRPMTIFHELHFEKYLNELVLPKMGEVSNEKN